MLTIKKAANKLGISTSKLYQLVGRKQIGHFRVGSKILFTDSDIESYLTGCRVEADAGDVKVTVSRVKPLRYLSLD